MARPITGPRLRPWRPLGRDGSMKGMRRSGGATGDVLEARAQLLDVAAELVEARAAPSGRRGRRPARRAASSRSERHLPPALAFPASAIRPRSTRPAHGRVGRDAADAGDLRPRHRPEVRDDRQGLERRLRQPCAGPAARPAARTPPRPPSRGAEGIAAGDVLQTARRSGPPGSGLRSARAPSRLAPGSSSVIGRARRWRAASEAITSSASIVRASRSTGFSTRRRRSIP